MAVFGNDKAALWPGQYVDLEIDQGVIADATVIPTVAIQPGQDGPFVYLVKPDNTIELRPTERCAERRRHVGGKLRPGARRQRRHGRPAAAEAGRDRLPTPPATAEAGQARIADMAR